MATLRLGASSDYGPSITLFSIIALAAVVSARPADSADLEPTLDMWSRNTSGLNTDNVRFFCIAGNIQSSEDVLRIRLFCPIGGVLAACFEDCFQLPDCVADPACATASCARHPTHGAADGGFTVGYRFYGGVNGRFECKYGRKVSRSLEFRLATTPRTATAVEATEQRTATTPSAAATTTLAATHAERRTTTPAAAAKAAGPSAGVSLTTVTATAYPALAGNSRSSVPTSPPGQDSLKEQARPDNVILLIVVLLSILSAVLIAILVALFICQSRRSQHGRSEARATQHASKLASDARAAPNEYSQLPVDACGGIYEELPAPALAADPGAEAGEEAAAADDASAFLVVSLPSEGSGADPNWSVAGADADASFTVHFAPGLRPVHSEELDIEMQQAAA